ncbi:collagen alpha-1(I) chain-like [Sus scrofa]|uniref:collagen alpha-1(I) chain-like n=1 Tax=Sus scrofa TaxID=9823 RepID=UPI000A2B7D89|nr:collagen alpha-1(I) chain-like [Sus scrofa]
MSPGVNLRSRASHARYEGWRGRSPVPGDSVRGPRARKVDKTSRATRVLVQAPRCQPDVPGDFGQAPSACGLDPRSQVTRARLRLGSDACGVPAVRAPVLESEGPRCRPVLPGQSGPGLRGRGVDKRSCVTPGRVRGPMSFTSLPGDSGPGPRALRDDQLFGAIRAWVRGPAVSTGSPVRLAPVPKGPRGRQAVFGDSGPGPRSACRRGQPDDTGDSGPDLRACGVDQLSRANRARVRARARGPTVSSSCPGDSDHARGPAGSTVVGDSGPGPKSNGFHQLSRVTKDWIRRPSVSTCCLGHSGPGPRARGIGQLSRANRARVRVPAGLTRFHGRFGPGPEGLRGRPAVLGDAGLAPKARGVDPLSRVTRAQERGPAVFSIPPGRMALVSVTRAHARSPAVSTRCPGRLRPGSKCLRARPAVPDSGSAPMPAGSQLSGPPVLESEGPRCRPVLPGQSGPGLRGRGVDKRSCVTPGRVRGPMSFTSLPGDSGPGPRALRDDQLFGAIRAWVRGPAVSTGSPVRLAPVPKGPRGRQAVFGDSGPGPRSACRRGQPDDTGDSGPDLRACGVDQLSRANRARVRARARGPTVSSSCPGDSDHARGPAGSTVVGDSGPGPKSNGFHQLSRVTKDWIRRPSVSTCCLGHSGPGPRARGIGQLSRANRARVRVPAGLTRFHGRFGPGPEGLRGRPAVLGDAGLAPKACGVDQLSRLTRAQAPGPARPVPDVARGQPAVPGLSRPVRGMAGSISGPGRLGPGPEGPQAPRCQPDVPGDFGQAPSACGLDPRSQTPARLRCLRGPSCPGPLCLSPRARGVDQFYRANRARV